VLDSEYLHEAKMNFAIASLAHFWNDAQMLPIFALAITVSNPPVYFLQQEIQAPIAEKKEVIAADVVPTVPFYSQFRDISSAKWQKVGCGVASLAMVIDFYKPDTVSVNALLNEGIKAGAYLNNAGWTYKGLIQISKPYGLDGKSFDLGKLSKDAAFAQFKEHLNEGPVIASVHYKFDPKSTIPHLVVIDGIRDGVVYYNDPAAKTGGLQISTADFLKAWKKRFIVVRPTETEGNTKVAFAK